MRSNLAANSHAVACHSVVLPILLLLALVSCLSNASCRSRGKATPVTITFSSRDDWHWPSKVGPDVIADFTRQTGIVVKTLPYSGEDLVQRRLQDLAWLESHSKTPDVYESDIVEVPAIAPGMIDLAPYIGGEAKSFMPSVIQNLTFEGKLIALPIDTDAGLLFYRTDLLHKVGFTQPPRTWDELTRMASVIQAKERANGAKDFWGFVWEGAPWEGLTYTALEWQASSGGGHIVEPDGSISVNNPWTIAALKRAKGWVGTISPPGVLAYRQLDIVNVWQAGRAAFIRSWPATYATSNGPDSPLRGKFAVTCLPSGGVGHTGTLGGWQLSVSRYSEHPREAAQFVQFLTSRQAQLRFAIEVGFPPVRRDIYDDPVALRVNPNLAWMKDTLPRISVARPAVAAGKQYTAVSDAYAKAVHAVLTGEKKPEDAMAELAKTLAQLTGLPIRAPRSPIAAGSLLP